MFTSNVQRAGNDMVLQQYLTKMNNKFSSKMEAVTSENAFVDFSWYHLHLDPLLKQKQPPSKLLTHKTQNYSTVQPVSDHRLTHHPKKKPAVKMTQVMTKIRKIMGPTTQSPQNNKKINKEDTTKQRFPPTKIKPDITIEQKLRENSPWEKVKCYRVLVKQQENTQSAGTPRTTTNSSSQHPRIPRVIKITKWKLSTNYQIYQ